VKIWFDISSCGGKYIGWGVTGGKVGGWLVSLFGGSVHCSWGLEEAMGSKMPLLLNNKTFLAPIKSWHGNKEIQETSHTF